jgi:SAM-dependent methyltransferase
VSEVERGKPIVTIRDAFFFTTGLGFLALAKGKHTLQGYTSPKPFDISEIDRCIEYDRRVVDEWLQELARYRGPADLLAGKNVLELGPGSDLGVGLLLLARGAAKYNACDVNNLAGRTPRSFYDALFAHLSGADPRKPARELESLRTELDRQQAGQPSRLNYVVRPDFDLLAAVGDASIDLVFSQAAFEHFDDIDSMVRQLTQVCKPGASIVAEIDLKTHSRWIRDHDPNNIYRYPDRLYELFWFRGIPNRVRPHQYEETFARHGWRDIQIHALATTGGPLSGAAAWSRRFRADVNRMDCLSIMFCATRGP